MNGANKNDGCRRSSDGDCCLKSTGVEKNSKQGAPSVSSSVVKRRRNACREGLEEGLAWLRGGTTEAEGTRRRQHDEENMISFFQVW